MFQNLANPPLFSSSEQEYPETHAKKPGLSPEPGTWDLLWHNRTQVVQTLFGDEAHASAPSFLLPGFLNQVLDIPHADELSSRQLEHIFARGISQGHGLGGHNCFTACVMAYIKPVPRVPMTNG